MFLSLWSMFWLLIDVKESFCSLFEKTLLLSWTSKISYASLGFEPTAALFHITSWTMSPFLPWKLKIKFRMKYLVQLNKIQ